MSTIADWFNSLPRAGKWLVVFVLFVAAYLLAIEPALDAANAARTRADNLEAALLRERRLLAPESDSGQTLELGMGNFGLPRHPAEAGARPEALQRTVNAVLLEHGVTNATYSERSGAIGAEEAAGVVGAGFRLSRFVLDVSFDADPRVVIAILSALESSRDVTAVSRVRIDKGSAGRARSGSSGSGRDVRATIAVESWIAAPEAPRSSVAIGTGGRS